MTREDVTYVWHSSLIKLVPDKALDQLMCVPSIRTTLKFQLASTIHLDRTAARASNQVLNLVNDLVWNL